MSAHSIVSLIGSLLRPSASSGREVVIIRIVEDGGPDLLNSAFPSLDPDSLELLSIEGEIAILVDGDMLGAQERFNELTRDAQAHHDAIGGGVDASIVYVGRITGAKESTTITTTNVIGHRTMAHHVFSNGTIGG